MVSNKFKLQCLVHKITQFAMFIFINNIGLTCHLLKPEITLAILVIFTIRCGGTITFFIRCSGGAARRTNFFFLMSVC